MHILIAEDDPSGRELAAYNVVHMGHTVAEAENGEQALALFLKEPFDIVLTDLKMPKMNGMELLARIRQLNPGAVVVVMTAYGDIETAVLAMKEGAFDFVSKPFSRDYLKIVLSRAAQTLHLRRQVADFEHRLKGVERTIIHEKGGEMERLLALSDRVAASAHGVLITGESGTGKELIARRIHSRSGRGAGPFVPVNCGAVPANLMESELFGHTKGAFTGADRDHDGKFLTGSGGTIFLDEISELELQLQTKLLRVLQEHEVERLGDGRPRPVDVRVIAATNRDLAALVRDGAFREDLFFRLNVFELHLLPLRERRGDIVHLFNHFLKLHGNGRTFTVGADFSALLQREDFPGNVRELENLAKRIGIIADSDHLDAATFERVVSRKPRDPARAALFSPGPEGIHLLDLERDVILSSLEYNQWNVSKTAAYLHVPRYFLAYRMEKYGIQRP